jgi:hypothetical protein
MLNVLSLLTKAKILIMQLVLLGGVFNKMFNIGSVQTVGLLLGASKASLELK